MDGKIQYELTLEVQKALSSLRILENSASKTGSRVGDIMQRALDRSNASGLADETAATVINLTRSGNAAEVLAKQLKEGHSRMKSMALLAGGLALDVAGSALKASGYASTAGILQTAGQSGLQMALTGAMVGGKKGGLLGAVVGIAAGGVKGYFDQQIQEIENARKETEAYTKALQESNISAFALMRTIGDIDKSEALYDVISQIDSKIADVQKRAKYGLIDPGIAKAQIEMLGNASRQASERLPGITRLEQASDLAENYKEREKKAKESRDEENAKREAAMRSSDQTRFGVDEAIAKALVSESLLDSNSTSEKLTILSDRNRVLEERIRSFDEFLKNADNARSAPEAIAQAASGYSESWSELLANRSLQSQIKRSAASPVPAGTLDSLGASGGYMRGSAALRDSGALSSAAADLSRQTARNTGEMVVLLRQIAGKRGATWQLR